MGSLFSEISGKFGKSLIFGCFIHVVFFLLLDWIFFRPFLPPLEGAAGALAALDREWKTVAIAGLAVLFSGLLYALNSPIVRFYEGYPWQHSFVGRLLKARQTRHWSRTVALGKGLQGVYPGEEAAHPQRARDLSDLSDQLLRRWRTGFPAEQGLVLPTRLGNTIRSFEDYPRLQYGMAAIPLYPRLLGVVEPGYATAMDEAKSSFDFMLNVSLLSAVSAGGLLLLGVGSRGLAGLSPAFWLQVAGLVIASRVFYAGSIGQAATWGNLVRGAFDLYRHKLLSQLGFTDRPADLGAERELWTAISQQMIFGDPPEYAGVPLLRFSKGGTFAVGFPATRPLRVSRSAGTVEGGWQTCLLVENPHPEPVTEVRVTDTLPAGERYLWNSALSDGRPLTVRGTDPVTIELGGLAPGEQRFVVYRSIK